MFFPHTPINCTYINPDTYLYRIYHDIHCYIPIYIYRCSSGALTGVNKSTSGHPISDTARRLAISPGKLPWTRWAARPRPILRVVQKTQYYIPIPYNIPRVQSYVCCPQRDSTHTLHNLYTIFLIGMLTRCQFASSKFTPHPFDPFFSFFFLTRSKCSKVIHEQTQSR